MSWKKQNGSAKKSKAPKKKKTRGPRIALRLPRDAQALYTRCVAILAAILADTAHFSAPYPPGAEVNDDLKALAAALQAAVGGGSAELTAVEVAADKVRQDFELLGKYVQSVVRAGPIEDAPAIISSVLLYVSNVGKRPPKPELTAKRAATSGAVQLVALAVVSAVAYFWEWSLDGASWVAGSPTAQAHTTVEGLTPGATYHFRFRALLRDSSLTDHSQVVQLIVT